jgi:Ca2+-dependent lipid-binding protein
MVSTNVMSSVSYIVTLLKTCQEVDEFVAIGFPDPFAVATVDGEQTQTTSVIKKTLNPYWNESFDVYGSRCEGYVKQ